MEETLRLEQYRWRCTSPWEWPAEMKHWWLARKRPVLLHILLTVNILVFPCLVVAARSLSASMISSPSVNFETVTVFSSCLGSGSSHLSRALCFRNSTASSSVSSRWPELSNLQISSASYLRILRA